jgi:hypothetical protein
MFDERKQLSKTNMFDEKLTNFDMNPFAIGVRFSKF